MGVAPCPVTGDVQQGKALASHQAFAFATIGLGRIAHYRFPLGLPDGGLGIVWRKMMFRLGKIREVGPDRLMNGIKGPGMARQAEAKLALDAQKMAADQARALAPPAPAPSIDLSGIGVNGGLGAVLCGQRGAVGQLGAGL